MYISYSFLFITFNEAIKNILRKILSVDIELYYIRKRMSYNSHIQTDQIHLEKKVIKCVAHNGSKRSIWNGEKEIKIIRYKKKLFNLFSDTHCKIPLSRLRSMRKQ